MDLEVFLWWARRDCALMSRWRLSWHPDGSDWRPQTLCGHFIICFTLNMAATQSTNQRILNNTDRLWTQETVCCGNKQWVFSHTFAYTWASFGYYWNHPRWPLEVLQVDCLSWTRVHSEPQIYGAGFRLDSRRWTCSAQTNALWLYGLRLRN